MSQASMTPRHALVLTHDRSELLQQCIDSLIDQVDEVLIIDNASDPPAKYSGYSSKVKILRTMDQPPNLSALWNRGFRWIGAGLDGYPNWNVAVLCDDTVIPPNWFSIVSETMRHYGAAAASTHQYSPVQFPILKTEPDNDLHNRMCGWAYMLAGEKKLIADEDLKWWWCDTDMDWQARSNGGMVICPGPVVHNIHPNDFTYSVPGLAEQAGADGETFARKYGERPW